MAERVILDNQASKHIDAYLEYVNIVGDRDGGKMMSEKEYEEFKEKVREARKNKLYVNWRNTSGRDWKSIGQESTWFCGHRYKYHNYDNVSTRKIDCRESKCKWKMFSYVPVYGSADLKWLWKHSYQEHDVKTRHWTRKGCKWSPEFSSKHPWGCGLTFNDHETVFESREERAAEGRAVDPKWMQENNMVGGSGGLTSFSGLIDQSEFDEMRDPAAIMANTKNAIEGYSALHAIEGGYEEEKNTKGIIAKGKSGDIPTQCAFDLFRTPHNFGSGTKAIAAGALGTKKGASSYKYK